MNKGDDISKDDQNVGCQGGAHDSPRFAGMTGEEAVVRFKEVKENERKDNTRK